MKLSDDYIDVLNIMKESGDPNGHEYKRDLLYRTLKEDPAYEEWLDSLNDSQDPEIQE